MPTYEYKCRTCGYSFDSFQSIHDEPLKVCPKCGREIRRVINGGSGVIFKGAGFYVTDAQKGKNTGSDTQELPAKAPLKKAETPQESTPPSSSSDSDKKPSG